MLSHLEAHWHVLEAEVVEINRDIEYCEQCLRKYGEWFNSPLQYLRVRGRPAAQRAVSATRPLTLHARRAQELKRTKKNKMCAPGPGWPQLACRGRAACAPRAGSPQASAAHLGLPTRASQEGDHPNDGELQQQPAGRQEARQIAGEAGGASARLEHPPSPTTPSPPARPTTSRAQPCIPACSQPVSVLQAPTTTAVVAPGAQPDAPALMVGSGATGYRSIKPVDA